MARPHGRDAPAAFAITKDGAQMLSTWWPPTSDRPVLGASIWVGMAQLGRFSSFPIYTVITADDTVLLALLRWTVIGPTTGPGCHGAERCQGLGLDWEVPMCWRKQP